MIHVAVIGYGRVGAAHAACYATLPGIRVSAVADISPPRRRAAATHHPDAQVVTDLDQVTTPIDLVLICTPPTSHEPLIEAALRRGAHVFCEKPVFLDPARGEQLVALAAAGARIIYPGHNYVFSPMLRKLRGYAQSGALGTIRHVTIQIARTGPAAGANDWHPTWRTDFRHSAGGVLTDHGPHCIYLTEWLSGQRITAATRALSDLRTDAVEHHAELTLSLNAGATAAVEMSWRSKVRTSTYALVGSTAEARLEDNRLYGPGDAPPDHGVHETPATSHAHDDWIPALARDVIASLTQPELLEPLTRPALTIARVLAGSFSPAAHRATGRSHRGSAGVGPSLP